MRLVVTDSYEHSARLVAKQVADLVRAKPQATLGLATGTTPIPVYKELARLHKEAGVDFSQVTTINLDEYRGVPGENPNSYLYFMKHHLFDPCEIPLTRVWIPDGMKPLQEELARMNAFSYAHPIDIHVLSVGGNGHIGFNEPNDVFCYGYHEVFLTEETRRSNARLFSCLEEVPKSAVTMGIGGIMQSKAISFLATGNEKLAAMKAILEEGGVTPFNQGTVLKLHQDCTIYLDEALAGQIQPASYVEVSRA
ncbi:MAG: glucosamine-6-phosphate deaminase [Christensenellaceae bacterium]|nr:glucosamine-6-phosphate deaminase [Christensenellaceae bacterium]